MSSSDHPTRSVDPDGTPGPTDTVGPGGGGRRAAHPTNPAGFVLLGEVGRGGMGVVLRAHDLALDREVAVKVLSDRFPADSPAAARFVEEARITARLQHPGIPAVYHTGTLPGGRPFLAMRLIRGRTLSDLLAGGDRVRGAGASGPHPERA
ncbi:MAG: hypothetical protein K2X87_34450, partial [Gemmataceae bacterium]|nr:hypothetical protein [Gemmataceae bacterium]